MLDCEAWTIQNNLAGVGDKASTAATLEDCRAECIDNDECTGVDWVAAQTTGRQCWVVGPWTRKSEARSGIDRHTLDRTCLTGSICIVWAPPSPVQTTVRESGNQPQWYRHSGQRHSPAPQD